MSKIAYCSIQEAWGIDYDELINTKTDISNDQNINESKLDNNINQDEEIKELEEKIKQLELQYEKLLI